MRAISDQLRDPIDSVERGFLLETLILNELRAYISYANIGGRLSYWSTSGKLHEEREIDFIWSRSTRNIGFEVKSAKRWRSNFGKYLKEFSSKKMLQETYGIYLGDEILKDGVVTVLPVKEFMKRLFAGDII